jgi:hypothetical protein
MGMGIGMRRIMPTLCDTVTVGSPERGKTDSRHHDVHSDTEKTWPTRHQILKLVY